MRTINAGAAWTGALWWSADSGRFPGRNPVYPIVRLPELTGETDLVSIDSRDIDAEIGVFIFPK